MVAPTEILALPPILTDDISNHAFHLEDGKATLTPIKDFQGGHRDLKGAKWILVVVAIFSTNFLFALDNTIVAAIQPPIIEDLGEIQKLSWISVGFPLAASTTNLIWGRLYSQFDIKILYIISIVIFEVGSTMCGAANSMDMLIGGRVIGGLGCQGMYLGVMTFIGALTTASERPVYISVGGIVWGVGTVLGPVVGAAFDASAATWRWSFYINLCIGAVFAPVYIWLLPSTKLTDAGSTKHRASRLDYLGTFLLMLTIPPLIVAITFGGAQFSWNSAAVISCFALSAIACALLILQQRFMLLTTQAHRIFPVQLIKSRELLILCLQTAAASSTGIIPIYYVPLFLQYVSGKKPLASAIDLLPLVVFLVISCLLSGGAVSRYGRYLPWFIAAGMFTIAGAAVMYTVKVETSIARLYGGTILLGIGAGAVMQLPYSISQVKVQHDELALVNGIMTQSQVGGITLTLAISNSVFLNLATEGMARALPRLPRAQLQSLLSGASEGSYSELEPDQLMAVLKAIVGAMRNAYLLVLVLGVLNLASSLFLRDRLYHTRSERLV